MIAPIAHKSAIEMRLINQFHKHCNTIKQTPLHRYLNSPTAGPYLGDWRSTSGARYLQIHISVTSIRQLPGDS